MWRRDAWASAVERGRWLLRSIPHEAFARAEDGRDRAVHGFEVIPYDIPRGCAAGARSGLVPAASRCA